MVEHSEASRKAVTAIIWDLSDRRGLGGEWDQVDEDIQEEIKDKWASMIDCEFRNRPATEETGTERPFDSFYDRLKAEAEDGKTFLYMTGADYGALVQGGTECRSLNGLLICATEASLLLQKPYECGWSGIARLAVALVISPPPPEPKFVCPKCKYVYQGARRKDILCPNDGTALREANDGREG